jgi:hypothetical protein
VKRFSRWQRDRQLRLARIRERRRRSRKKRRAFTEAVAAAPPDHIVAPKRIDINAPWGEQLRLFIDQMIEAVETGKRAKLDFRRTEMMYPLALILLFAELDRLIAVAKHPRPFTIVHSRSVRIREVMKQIGLYDLTGAKSSTIPTRADVVFWRSAKGSDQSGDRIAMIKDVVAEAVKLEPGAELILASLWRGVSEAISNSVDHAHKVPREADGFAGLPGTKWWLFTQVRNGSFIVLVCDLGCGYRATIGQTVGESFIARMQQAFAGENIDAIAIETAMEFGRSGTKEVNRGKGSRDAISVVEKHRAGQLMICSNTGVIHYNYREGKRQTSMRRDLGFSINGTIVWWKLPLRAPE